MQPEEGPSLNAINTPGLSASAGRFERKRRPGLSASAGMTPPGTPCIMAPMSENIDMKEAWAAFERRDRSFDGRFVVAVRTTGIYCKPSCAARRPRRENVRILADAAAARAGGFRACRRCLPDSVGRDRAAVAQAIALMTASDEPPALAALATAVGYTPHHFHRLFKRATGLTPAAYARALRADRAAAALRREAKVTDAIYDAGYAAPSRFYADAARLGMTPARWARGGDGADIRWAVVPTSLGPLLLAATADGLCRVAFGEDEGALHRHFPAAAAIVPGDAAWRRAAAALVRRAELPERDTSLPAEVRTLAFAEAVREAAAQAG